MEDKVELKRPSWLRLRPHLDGGESTGDSRLTRPDPEGWGRGCDTNQSGAGRREG